MGFEEAQPILRATGLISTAGLGLSDRFDSLIGRRPPLLAGRKSSRPLFTRTAHRLFSGPFQRGFRLFEIKPSSHVVHPRN